MKSLGKGLMEFARSLVGSMAILFGLFAADWWCAHQMAWWSFSVLTTGAVVFCAVMFGFVSETRKGEK